MFSLIWYKIFRRKDLIDVTGIKLTPSKNGKKCLGNGKHKDKKGNLIECCCDECDFLKICIK